MKFKTFRILAAGGAVAVIGGGAWLLTHGPAAAPKQIAQPQPQPKPTPPPPPQPTPTPNPNPNPTPTPTPTAQPSPSPSPSPGALRPLDDEILRRVAAGIPGDKLNDAVPGRPWKVNLYKDSGQTGVNRLKLDLDRDGKWDEKWTFKPDGKVKREVAPADDEAYTEHYELKNGAWKTKD